MNEVDDRIANFLTSELSKRVESNAKYSLRAFAKYLDLSPAALSLILQKKRAPSRKVFEKIKMRFMSDGPLYQRFKTASEGGSRLDNTEPDNLDLETFEKISTWTAYAILSLIITKSFQSNLKWIAKRLGVSVYEASDAVEALRSAGILDTSGVSWTQKTNALRINNKYSTAITKRFQRQMLEKAMFSLENDSLEIRDMSSITIAFPVENIDEAKAFIRSFRHRFTKKFENPESANEVYNLTIQLTPITK